MKTKAKQLTKGTMYDVSDFFLALFLFFYKSKCINSPLVSSDRYCVMRSDLQNEMQFIGNSSAFFLFFKIGFFLHRQPKKKLCNFQNIIFNESKNMHRVNKTEIRLMIFKIYSDEKVKSEAQEWRANRKKGLC